MDTLKSNYHKCAVNFLLFYLYNVLNDNNSAVLNSCRWHHC